MKIRVFFDQSDYIDFNDMSSYDFVENHLRLSKDKTVVMIPLGHYVRFTVFA